MRAAIGSGKTVSEGSMASDTSLLAMLSARIRGREEGIRCKRLRKRVFVEPGDLMFTFPVRQLELRSRVDL